MKKSKESTKKFLKILRNRKIQLIFLGVFSVALGCMLFYVREFQVMPQIAIKFLQDVKVAGGGDKVLVFSPHPDDETIACGGYIHDSITNGASVSVILVTDGNKHHLKDKRYQEFKKVTGILGVNEANLVFLNHHDGELKDVDKNVLDGEIKDQIEKYNPNIIVFPLEEDTHPDHATTGKEVAKVISEQHYKVTTLQYLVHENRFPQPKKLRPNLYLLPPLSKISFDNEWQRHMLSADTEKTKLRAIRNYRTQLKVPILRSLILSFVRKNELFVVDKGTN